MLTILKKVIAMCAVGVASVCSSVAYAQDKPADADNFYKSATVKLQKVSFKNQYNMAVAVTSPVFLYQVKC